MTLEQAIQQRQLLRSTIGQNSLSQRFSSEFELYVCALELLDENLNTLEYFIFPVMPKSISETMPQLTTVKKTAGGISVLRNPQFVTKEISISGSFGRKFHFLMGTTYQELISTFRNNGQTTAKSFLRGSKAVFDERIKTGFGCLKVLESIIEGLKDVSFGGVKQLIFYNLALDHSYVIEPTSLTFSQSIETNMVWDYSLQFKAVADASAVKDVSAQLLQIGSDAFVQKQVDKIVNNLGRITKNATPNFVSWK